MAEAARPRAVPDHPKEEPVRLTHLDHEQRGSTWTVKDAEWSLILVARHVYYGTGRILATATLARTDVTPALTILTSHVDFLTATQRRNFSREAARRLKLSSTASEDSNEAAIGALMDALLEQLLNAQNEIEIISAADIDIPADLTPPYAIWPLVPRSRPGMLVGRSGQGKSGLALLGGLSVVMERSILERIEPRTGGQVIYVGQEEDRYQWAARLQMLCRGHGIADRPKGYHYVRLKGSSLIDSVELIAEQVATKRAALVIIDSAQATWGDDGDNVRGHATLWYEAVSQLGTAVLVVEHPNAMDQRKNGHAEGGFAAGTTVKRDRVGHSWSLKSQEIPPAPGAPYQYHVTLHDDKRNYVARQEDITYIQQIFGFEWMRFLEADVLTAGGHIDASRLWAALASIMRHPDEYHEEVGWQVDELADRLKQKDSRRIRHELTADFWRAHPDDPAIEEKAQHQEGTGSGRGNPAIYRLIRQYRTEGVSESDPEE